MQYRPAGMDPPQGAIVKLLQRAAGMPTVRQGVVLGAEPPARYGGVITLAAHSGGTHTHGVITYATWYCLPR
jgi:hypothetical protein